MSSKCVPLPPSKARLREAITDARIFQTKQLLDSGAEVEFVDEEGLSPLLRVCLIEDGKHRTRSSLLKLLLQHGANVNRTDPQGRHALAWCCIHGKEDIVRLLLGLAYYDIDLNKQDNEGNTPLMQAVKSGNANIVKLLVDALNKFKIDIDVRNHEDRTPYLEAKHLGHEECAEILLKEGKASKDIQVNPFLDFLAEEGRLKGGIRGVEGLRPASTITKNNFHVQQRKAGAKFTESSTSVTQDVKRRLKRKASSSKKAGSLINASNKLRERTQQRRAWVQSKKTGNLLETERDSITVEEFSSAEQVTPASVTSDNARSNLATPETSSRVPKFLSVDEFRVARSSRPPTARPQRSELNKSNSSLDLRCVRERAQAANEKQERLRGRPKTGLQRAKSSASLDNESVYSWHSHFSVYTTPSVKFLQKLMAIYAEQVSPQSSYRGGVTAQVPLPFRPTILQPEDDARSEGGRSSAGSTRSSRAGLSPSRKFSSVTRSVISSRRVFGSVMIHPTKGKVS